MQRYMNVFGRDDVKVGRIETLVRNTPTLCERLPGSRLRPQILMSVHPDDIGVVIVVPPTGFLDQLCREYPRSFLRRLDAALRAKGESKFGPDTQVQLMDVRGAILALVSVDVLVIVKGKHPLPRQAKVAALNQVIWKHFGAAPGDRHTRHCDSGQRFIVDGEVVSSLWQFSTEFHI